MLILIQQINFTENLDTAANTTILFIIEEAQQSISYFSESTEKVF